MFLQTLKQKTTFAFKCNYILFRLEYQSAFGINSLRQITHALVVNKVHSPPICATLHDNCYDTGKPMTSK